jgi:hypothetical protein
MTLDDPPDVGKPDPGALEFLATVEALKDAEQLVDIPHVKPDTIVADVEHYLMLAVGAADLDLGFGAGTRVLDSVGQEIPEDEPQHRGIALHLR